MKPWLIFLLVFVIFSCSQKQQKSDERPGLYSGTIEHGNFSDFITFEIKKDSVNFNVSFTSLEQNANQIPFQKVEADGDSISFELRSDYYTYLFRNLWVDNNSQLQGVLYVDTVVVPYVLSKDFSKKQIIQRYDEVDFESNGLIINGTIWYPDTPNKNGLVLITSSGNADRSASRAEAILFTQKGFTTFHYDKRGTGISEGDWVASTMEELVSDDINAIKYFSKTTRLPLSNIGIKGSSQGGVKVPNILNTISDLKYGIAASCPGVSLLESDLNYWKNRNVNIPKQDIDQAAKLQRKVYEYIAGNITRGDIESLIGKAKSASWFQDIWIPNLDEFQLDTKLNYNPIPYFERTKQPILILQGTEDEIIPDDSYVLISNALEKAPTSRFVIALLEGANHSMYDIGKSDFPYWSKLHPEYFNTIEDWINSVYEKK